MKITGFESNNQIRKELAERIKSKRIDSNYSQSSLAKKAGISLRTLINIESGKPVNIDMLLNVLRALNILSNIDILVEEEIIRPYDYFNLNKKRERVRKVKEKNINYKWKDSK